MSFFFFTLSFHLKKVPLSPYYYIVQYDYMTNIFLCSPAPILDALTLEMRLEKPFKIQAKTLPYIMANRNIIAQAQAGAGKTIAFAIGMLTKINSSESSLQALCLTPTRELAIQILSDAIAPLKRNIVPEVICEAALAQVQVPRGGRSNAHLVVGTPGKVGEWITKKYIKLSAIKVFVMDEADIMVGGKESFLLFLLSLLLSLRLHLFLLLFSLLFPSYRMYCTFMVINYLRLVSCIFLCRLAIIS